MPSNIPTRLWIDGKSLAAALIAHLSIISNQRICEINQANAQELGGHRLDRFTLAAIECAAIHNSLTENSKSKIEEVGTAGIKGLLREMGFDEVHGTVLRIAMELLEEAGRIKCIDRSYVQRKPEEGHEGRCRRYIPAGRTWALPFIENIDVERLSPAQQRSRAAYQCQQMRKREQAAARRAIAAAPRPAPIQPPTPPLYYKGVWSSIPPACASQRAPSTPCTAPSDFDAWYFEAFREELNREHCAPPLPEWLGEDHAMVPNEFENLADFLAWAQAIAA